MKCASLFVLHYLVSVLTASVLHYRQDQHGSSNAGAGDERITRSCCITKTAMYHTNPIPATERYCVYQTQPQLSSLPPVSNKASISHRNFGGLALT